MSNLPITHVSGGSPLSLVAPRKQPAPQNAASTTSDRKRPKVADSPSPSEGSDQEADSAGEGPKQLIMSHEKPQGPYMWTATHQIIWLGMGKMLPPNLPQRPWVPIESIATPVNVDISVLTIPLTAKELLTFFPRHTHVAELQDRLTRNGIGGTDQANIINMQRDLHIPHIITGMQIRTHIKNARKRIPKISPAVPCTEHRVSHYNVSINSRTADDRVLIDYPLMDCFFGVHGDAIPAGRDCGPFTEALMSALVGRHDVMLSEMDRYIQNCGINRNLHPGYTDADFLGRHKEQITVCRSALVEEAKTKGYRWEG
ncbi:hypothetical protein BDW02DRAFT_602814 [Decorospora gaudefroyi]|uniref:Uncharacterized protein n=1 Tax=Decorospora gaudefroyi TaxID=184978 RepID=A0A6A5K3U1_9PLEO|nr:hypothetical protein BDW02DRAFT_602814 [Decorospora gaudefroyi]